MCFRGSHYLGLDSVALMVFFPTHVNSLVVKKILWSYFSSTFYGSGKATLLLGMAALFQYTYVMIMTSGEKGIAKHER